MISLYTNGRKISVFSGEQLIANTVVFIIGVLVYALRAIATFKVTDLFILKDANI